MRRLRGCLGDLISMNEVNKLDFQLLTSISITSRRV